MRFEPPFAEFDLAQQKIPWKSEEILNWLSTEGYPFEYQVAHKYFQNGFDPVLDLHIASANSSKAREIDVCVDIHVNSPLPKKIRLLIECKYTMNPWLLMSGFSQIAGVVETDFFPRSQNVPWFTNDSRQMLDREIKLKEDGYFGKNPIPSNAILEPQKNKNTSDIPYKTLMKITDASRDMISLIDSKDTEVEMICIPCIIISHELFSCSWQYDNQKFDLEPCKTGRIYWMGHGTRNCVFVGSGQHLDTFVEQSIQMATSMAEFWEEEL